MKVKIKHEKIIPSMYEHGSYDSHNKKWFCSYFMSLDEWIDTHDYMPPNSEDINSLDISSNSS